MRKLKDTPMNRAIRKYQRTERGKRKLRERVKRWRARNRFNLDTIILLKPFPECEECPEDYNRCPVELGSESIKICAAWVSYKHTGIQPLHNSWTDEPQYDPSYIDFEYIHDDQA